MKVEKEHIVDLPGVYATAELSLNGKRYLAAASENKGETAYLYSPDTNEYNTLWNGETGVMNLVQVPGRDMLYCITRFYPIFQSKEATICSLVPNKEGYSQEWEIKDVALLPFCHRIGIVTIESKHYLLGCTLCGDKAFQEDWSMPGAVWISEIPEDAAAPLKFNKIYEGLTKNHGLFIQDDNQVFVTSENGVMLFDLSQYKGDSMIFPTLLSTKPTSDIWISKDGETQYVSTIEPFHGDSLKLYQCRKDKRTVLFSSSINFGHVVWNGEVFGKKSILVADREETRKLELIFWQTGESMVIDENVGATQISLYNEGDNLKIFSANHYKGEVALYTIKNY